MDDILQLRDYYYAGYNDYCLQNYEHVKDKSEVQEYIYQIYMIKNINNDIILNLKNNKNNNLYFLYLYYKYYYLNEKDDVLTEIKKLKLTSSNTNILKTRIYFDNDYLDECFELLENGTIEMKVAKMFYFLSINRIDLVKDIINEFLKVNDEIPIIKICLAVYYLYNNTKESFLIFDDLESYYSITNDTSKVILNGKAVSNILSYEFQDAIELLKSSLKNCINNDTLCNLILCYLYLYEIEEAENYLTQLYNSSQPHDVIDSLKKIDDEIDNFVCDI